MSAKPSGNATRTVIAVVGTKGGIGKTTVTNGLAGALALKGHTVSVIDADPQGSSLAWADTALRNGAGLSYRTGSASRNTLPASVAHDLTGSSSMVRQGTLTSHWRCSPRQTSLSSPRNPRPSL